MLMLPCFCMLTKFLYAWRWSSQLAVGGLCGNVDIFDACVRKELYKGTFEFTYITKSQVKSKATRSFER